MTELFLYTPTPLNYIGGENTFSLLVSADNQLYMQNQPGFRIEANFVNIDWGDGTFSNPIIGGSFSFPGHIYQSEGTFTITISINLTNPNKGAQTKTFENIITILPSKELVEETKIRINTLTPVILPFRGSKIPVNEWIEHTAVNTIFKQLLSNIEYLKSISSIYKLGPFNKIGTASIIDNKLDWYTNHIQPNIEFENIPQSDLDIVDVCSMLNFETNKFIVTTQSIFYQFQKTYNTNSLQQLSIPLDGFESPKNIKSIDIAPNGNVYLLDDKRLKISVYNIDNLTGFYAPIFNWGGLGGPTSKTKFYKPTDIKITNNTILVTDSGNDCLKEFTLTGQWVRTYKATNLDSPFISSCKTAQAVFGVTSNNIVKFNLNGDVEYSKPIQFLSSPVVGITQIDGFLYILTEDNVIRVFPSGESTNIFAQRTSTTPIYKSIFADRLNNLYINTGKNIIKYAEAPVLLKAARDNDNYWNEKDILIKEDDFVTSSTYNRVFHRIYDNLHNFFHTIDSKVILKSDGTLERVPLEKCDIGAWQGLPIEKEEIYIGLNEFVTPEVINRCINKLLIVQQYILDVLMNEYSGCETGNPASFKIDLPFIPECCWTWEARRTQLCCVTWSRLRDNQCVVWEDAKTCCVNI